MPANSNLVQGKGVVVAASTTSGGTFANIARMTSAPIPESSFGMIDATCYTSTGTEKIPDGWFNVGDTVFEFQFTSSQAVTLYGFHSAETLVYWKITLSDGSVYAFTAYVSKIGGPAIPLKDMVKQNFTLTITGLLSYTPPT